MSANAALQAPTKMGFATGTTVTVDNAIKMLMVKSANDVAVVLAEGVSGSVENFADEMNRQSKRLGMTQSHWVNPNGLPADNQVTSARDMAILARAVIKEFPQYNYYWNLPGIRYGKRVMRNHNNLMGRYVGTDGMKTGFICASGFNVVATATRGNKRLIAVVLGSQSPAVRAVKAAQLFERGFQVSSLSWLTPALGLVDQMQPVNVDPPNLRESDLRQGPPPSAVGGSRGRAALGAGGLALRRLPRQPAGSRRQSRHAVPGCAPGRAGHGLHRAEGRSRSRPSRRTKAADKRQRAREEQGQRRPAGGRNGVQRSPGRRSARRRWRIIRRRNW